MMNVRQHKPLHPSHTFYSVCKDTHCTSFLAWICQKAQSLLHSFLSTQYVPCADMCCSWRHLLNSSVPVLASSTRTCSILFVFAAQAVTPQVAVSRHGAVNRGTKRARDAGGYSTGQTHTPTPAPTPTNKSRKLSHVEITCRVGKQLPQVGLQPHLIWPCGNTLKANFGSFSAWQIAVEHHPGLMTV